MKESDVVRRGLPALAAVLCLGVPTAAWAATPPSTTSVGSTPATDATATTVGAPAVKTTAPTSTTAAQASGGSPIDADTWILVDADTGAVLAGKAIHTPHLTASTVKTVTALTALRILGADAAVQVSSVAASRAPMKIGMVPGQQWSMRQTLYSLLLVSANDAAYALAQSAAGSIEGFAKQMTATGAALGLEDSTFLDPAGFDGTDTVIGPSKMSAYDLAVVARAVLRNAILGPIVATRSYTFTGPDGLRHRLVNHSKLLTLYTGANGIKTGWTRAAKGTFVGSATRNGRTLIAVVLGAGDIYKPVIRLFDYGFSRSASLGGTGETLPGLASASPASTTPTSAAAVTETTPAPSQLVPITATATTLAAVTSGGRGWLSLMGGGLALLVACLTFWRLAASTSRRRRYDRVLGRVADLEVTRG